MRSEQESSIMEKKKEAKPEEKPQFTLAQIEKQEQAEMEEKISEMVISKEVKAKLMRQFHQWRRVELMTVIFSLLGLVIVIVDYEIDLYLRGYAGIADIHDTKKNPPSLIRAAIYDREHNPNTRFLKIINII
jgi:hypothetical protein